MKLKNATEVKDYLWDALGLSKRAIVFHLLDVDDGKLYFSPDLIDSMDGLYDSDEFIDICLERTDEQTIHVSCVESYVIGDGEADHAGYYDCELLEGLMEDNPNAMDSFLRNVADQLAAITDFTLENPEYEEDDDE